jgi:hypothetical protein
LDIGGVLIVGGILGLFLDYFQIKNKDIALKALLAQNKTLTTQIEDCRVHFEARSARIMECDATLDYCNKDLKEAQANAKKCPGACNIPDCRKLDDMLVALDVCMAFVATVKAVAAPKVSALQSSHGR